MGLLGVVVVIVVNRSLSSRIGTRLRDAVNNATASKAAAEAAYNPEYDSSYQITGAYALIGSIVEIVSAVAGLALVRIVIFA